MAQARRELAVREHRDIALTEVAAAIGVSKATVSRWEGDQDTPREAALEKLAAFLGVTPAYLRYGITDAPAPRGAQMSQGGIPAPNPAAAKAAKKKRA